MRHVAAQLAEALSQPEALRLPAHTTAPERRRALVERLAAPEDEEVRNLIRSEQADLNKLVYRPYIACSVTL